MADESPLDRFRAALTATARAVAREPELDVSWTSDAPAQVGNTVRVPMPGRKLEAGPVASARGVADSYALKRRYHDAQRHLRGRPAEPMARAAFDAIEQVRWEALGANAMGGMRDNLAAALDKRIATDPISRADRVEDAPISTALALMLREHLTGEAVPQAARAGVDLRREQIESAIGGDFDDLLAAIGDQSEFQKKAIGLLEHLELIATEPDPEEAGEEGDEPEGEETQDEEDDLSDSSQEDMRVDQQPGDADPERLAN